MRYSRFCRQALSLGKEDAHLAECTTPLADFENETDHRSLILFLPCHRQLTSGVCPLCLGQPSLTQLGKKQDRNDG